VSESIFTLFLFYTTLHFITLLTAVAAAATTHLYNFQDTFQNTIEKQDIKKSISFLVHCKGKE
jgi:hypothetical protein